VKPGADVYCVGNPPFIGHQYRSAEQQADMHMVWGRDGKVNRLDYVTCWYRKGVDWMAGDDRAECCFVSTNSICQGEQVGTLWGELLQRGVRIRFAHRTFQWTSEARGRAAVHCVIIGFGLREPARRLLFDYPNIRGEPQQIEARNINPYLVDAADVLMPSRTQPPAGYPRMLEGSKPVDGGHLILSQDERDEMLLADPALAAWIKPLYGGRELLDGQPRWCLWLKGIKPETLRNLTTIHARLAQVREARLKSPTAEFRKFADLAYLFVQDRQPDVPFTALPKVSSENRRFIPVTFMDPSCIITDKILYLPGHDPFRFSILNSTMHMVWGRDGKVNRLDYVTCWYRKGVDWMAGDDRAECCFVSTNSICQGEQVGTLWGELLQRGVRIRFAHRTFQWTSEARGRAAVHCVIIGFGLREPARRLLFDYPNIRGEPQQIEARNINPYLVDAADVLMPSRTQPPAGFPRMLEGSKPVDGGHLILSQDERDEMLSADPALATWIKPLYGGRELLDGQPRWCLWLKGIKPETLRGLTTIHARLAKVREARLKSPTAEFRKFADLAYLFVQDRQPDVPFTALPKVSSENRRFIPVTFMDPSCIITDKILYLPGHDPFRFSILNSTMHMAWMRVVAGRLKSDYSYAPAVYNNFPWPTPTEAQRAAIERTAQGILDRGPRIPAPALLISMIP
jgi:hypothetical protein